VAQVLGSAASSTINAVRLPAAAARSYLDVVLLPLMQVTPSATVFHRALDVRERWGFSFYDSLIVASAMHAGCTTLLSEDLQHGQVLDGLRVVDPFRASFAAA
jgi:predicted nucleic acid-binding protein